MDKKKNFLTRREYFQFPSFNLCNILFVSFTVTECLQISQWIKNMLGRNSDVTLLELVNDKNVSHSLPCTVYLLHQNIKKYKVLPRRIKTTKINLNLEQQSL